MAALLNELAHNHRGLNADWAPLSVDGWNMHDAGTIFFDELTRVNNAIDRAKSALPNAVDVDLLEVFWLCLALGFKGKFDAKVITDPTMAATMQENLIGTERAAAEKLQRLVAANP